MLFKGFQRDKTHDTSESFLQLSLAREQSVKGTVATNREVDIDQQSLVGGSRDLGFILTAGSSLDMFSVGWR